MFERLERWKPELLGLMRIADGHHFLEHGTQKLFGFPVPPPGRLALSVAAVHRLARDHRFACC